ncbi:hypothetical protein GCM10011415_11460 [Salipiger pallidus]|uniref:Membrane-anchored ribosome-binding protein, inhibits growth in stationary phase, ElaB/YqjD/DUF883 family n=1 Tax=Salipiger pallidus TaxID=1775170 RepID=A0A8J2ZID5_9RHOB|nr:hypothetical protein [Salipiger pallidus]GGG66382.1 hypothetical protein GCM10011415_11460 [Salipiger pallidus]
MTDPSQDTPTTHAAESAAREMHDDLRTKARNTADEVKQRASGFEEEQRGHMADEVSDVSNALRKAAEEMRSGSPQERTMSQIASTLADASDSIRDKDLGEMAGGLSDFARRNPLAYLGGAAVLGFAASRFAKAGTSGSTSTASQPAARPATAAPARPADFPTQSASTPAAATPATPAYHRQEPEDF